jgi:hypothetical protein
MYILLHESTHLVDYIENITPYTEPEYKKFLKIKSSETDFTKSVWKDYDIPRQKFPFTKKITFYGFNKPQLHLSESVGVYTSLTGSPFVSLYGSLSWAEDLAELTTYYHMTRILNQPFIISVMRDRKKILSIYPLNSPAVKKRLALLKKFYSD